ncbi:MAG TPA: hypothetical protein VN642_16510 [Dongiaceae bacterium]|nr:hypothetical protein [Dongiaceae bacterium]
MKIILMFLLIAMPCTVFADCIITDYSEKFEVVCSGYNPAAPPMKKGARISTKMGKSKKLSIADREGITSAVGMTDEELRFMQARNRMDGYRAQKKQRVQTARNLP